MIISRHFAEGFKIPFKEYDKNTKFLCEVEDEDFYNFLKDRKKHRKGGFLIERQDARNRNIGYKRADGDEYMCIVYEKDLYDHLKEKLGK